MRALLLAASVVFFMVSAASADEFVNGYFRQNGTYVAPHMRSSPDGNPFNNYSTQGNTNPYTGVPGTHNPYSTTPSYGLGTGTLRWTPKMRQLVKVEPCP